MYKGRKRYQRRNLFSLSPKVNTIKRFFLTAHPDGILFYSLSDADKIVASDSIVSHYKQALYSKT